MKRKNNILWNVKNTFRNLISVNNKKVFMSMHFKKNKI